MSSFYWPILGYGLLLRMDFFDQDKFPGDEMELYDITYDIIEFLEPRLKHLIIGTTGELYSQTYVYLYLQAKLPWETSDITQKDVEDEIYYVLSPYLNDFYSKEKITKLIGEIAEGGGA